MEIENRESKIENRGALFLDRDGTLIIDKDYLADPAGVEILPGIPAALRRARELGYELFLFTNQSGIGRGYYTLDQAHAVNARMDELLGLPAPIFREICIAPERPDQPSLYRKPSPRFIQEMIARYALDPAHCYMVGDRPSDIESGQNAGVHPIAVCTGKLSADEWRDLKIPALRIYADFGRFVDAL
ncbi:MAG: HAD-IIIA family hydrolase [Verrucomicrobia bacterium]|nr:HAD-IIIA family hydrolase [Verrucomicrobiota bacterium]